MLGTIMLCTSASTRPLSHNSPTMIMIMDQSQLILKLSGKVKGVRVKGEVGIKSIKGGLCSESLTVATSLFTLGKEQRSHFAFYPPKLCLVTLHCYNCHKCHKSGNCLKQVCSLNRPAGLGTYEKS
jgi:hypothetical protein